MYNKQHRIIRLFGIWLFSVLLLSGCSWFCEHQWKPATCTAPPTCELCGKTEGEMLPHRFKPATCVELQTCSDCGLKEGVLADHKWMTATCIAPDTCTVCGETRGELLPHKWRAATCTKPETCTVCGKTQGEPVPHTYTPATCTTLATCTACGSKTGELAPHNWSPATCKAPMQCSACGVTQGGLLNHSWEYVACEYPYQCSYCGKLDSFVAQHDLSFGSSDEPRFCSRCGKMFPCLIEPITGYPSYMNFLFDGSSLTIKSDYSSACFVKLKDRHLNDVYSYYVPAGCTFETDVERGSYYVYFACGKDWYGLEYLFGEHTQYYKDNTLLDFTNYTYTYTLYPVENGNLTLTPIDESEF